MTNSKEQNFQKERKDTDKSLGDEREKTNRSLSRAKDKAELQTDVSVQEERAQTDKATLVARENADSHHASDDRTETERKNFDEAMVQERATVDVAIVREREVKSTIETKILSQERELTDKSLAVERKTTDTEVRSASNKLSAEVKEHSKTKFSLTTRDEFLAIVSHDLRNPIGAVSSCMEVLLEEPNVRNFDAETKGWIEMAKRNADSALRLIRDILDMERIVEGKLQISVGNFEIGKIIRESIESFAQTAISKNLILRFIPMAAPCDITCDRDRVLQVLSNLIGNALKFTPDGGKIVLRAEKSDDVITISVSDTGAGIPEEKKLKIFEKFAQIGSKDRRGLGLGLHISKMLVEAHGGSLWVDSKLGNGSTFYFSIPNADVMIEA